MAEDLSLKAFACLQQLERSVLVEKRSADASSLLSFLSDADYAESWLVRAKALVVLGRLADSTVAGELLSGALGMRPEPWNQPLCWRLQFLDAWWQLPLPDEERLQGLRRILADGRQSPVLWRAAIWCLGRVQDNQGALRLLADFIGRPQSGVILDDLLADSWYRQAAQVDEAFLQELTGQNPRLNSWLSCRYGWEPLEFGFYPGSDYLWQQAAEQGVERRQFKQIYFYPRNKKAAKEPGKGGA